MICPKCQNVMRTVNKNGVHIEQCEGCRGIFLDRGELEQIAGAESAYYGGPPAPYAGGHGPVPHGGAVPYGRPDSPRPFRGGGYSDSPGHYRGGHGGYADSPHHYGHGGGYGHRRKKRSFLEELFD